MSINNLEFSSYNFLTNLASVNADEVNTNVLTKSDPDISDLQFDMLEGINTNENIQEQIDNVTVDVSTLQGQMNTANTNISTLQVNMGIAQSDINTLQSEMNTAQGDINDLQTDVGVLYGLTATNTAAIAGLSVSQAAQDVTIAAHTASIASLNTDVFNLQSDVTALEVKTTDQSWGSLSGTTFSSKVNVGGVTLNLSTASIFNNGISASAPITTTSTMSSTSGTSSFNALNVNTTIEVIGDAIIGNTLYVGRTVNVEKKVVLYDGGTDNDYDYTGMWTSQFVGKNYFNYEIDGTGGSYRWHYGNGLGNARKKILDINDAEFYSYNATFSFLNSQIGGQTQNITFTDNAFGTFYMNWKTDPDNTASQNRDAAIVVDAGADGVEDDGTMTFVAGAHDMTSVTRGINITGHTLVQINTGTSGFDVNATGPITIDGTTTAFMKTAEDFNIETTNATGDINFTSAGGFGVDSVGPVSLTSTTNTLFLASLTGGISQQAVGSIELSSSNNFISLDAGPTHNINLSSGATVKSDCVDFDVNATGAVTIDGATVALNGTTTILGVTSINETGVLNTKIGNTTGTLQLKGSGISLSGSTLINDATTAATSIGNTTGTLQLKGSTNTITGVTNINHLNTLATTIGNTTGILTLRGATIINTTGTANTTIGNTTGTVDITASTNTVLGITNINRTGTSATSIGNATGTLTLQGNFITNQAPTRNTGLTYPITDTTSLGYHIRTTTTTKMTAAQANLASLAIPAAGCYLVEGNFIFTGTTFQVEAFTTVSLSTTSATVDITRQQTVYQGNVGGNYAQHITSIINFTAAGTVYFVGLAQIALPATPTQSNTMAITRIA